jgi:hypothetical protein
MVNQDAHTSTRGSLELFERGRSRLLRSLAALVAKWPESIASHLEEQSASLDPQTQTELAATGLRFRNAQLTMASRLESCLLRRSDAALQKAQALSQGADLMESLREAAATRRDISAQLAQSIRESAGVDYLHWLARNASLIQGLGAMPELDEIHPLGAPLLAECVFSVLSIGSGERNGNLERLWPFLQAWLRGPCVDQLVEAIRDANGYLRDAGVLRSLPSQHAAPSAKLVPQKPNAASPPAEQPSARR